MEYHSTQAMAQLKRLLLRYGYNPTVQLSGFLLTGDPGYLPPGRARRLASHMEREDLLEDLVRQYLDMPCSDWPGHSVSAQSVSCTAGNSVQG